MKKLIIVCEERLRHYGDFLAQLISSSDDAAEQSIGLKDGVAAAQVWTEKEYSSNAAQISSEQYILFIGNSKLIKEKRMHMRKKYSEYGMNYGWLGKQGVLFVDHVVTYSEYSGFYKLLSDNVIQGNQPEIARLIEAKADNSEQNTQVIEIPIDENVIENSAEKQPAEKENLFKKFLEPIGKTARDTVKKTADFGADQLKKISDDITAASKSKDIEDQEYTCLVLMFYLRDCGRFLGISEA